MDVRIDVTVEAENDLASAFAWYENRRFGLGEDFLSSVDVTLARIRRHPELYAKVYRDYRRAIVRRFPYAVFYEYVADNVTVYAVFHTAQDSHKWRQRLS
jgi:toxin ParE1/3/4